MDEPPDALGERYVALRTASSLYIYISVDAQPEDRAGDAILRYLLDAVLGVHLTLRNTYGFSNGPAVHRIKWSVIRRGCCCIQRLLARQNGSGRVGVDVAALGS